jgi:hypothetical protein
MHMALKSAISFLLTGQSASCSFPVMFFSVALALLSYVLCIIISSPAKNSFLPSASINFSAFILYLPVRSQRVALFSCAA